MATAATELPAMAADRRDVEGRPILAGVKVRDSDIEPVKGIRTIAVLFRGMAILLLVLMILQVFFAVTSAVPISVGVLLAESVRLIIFAGLLWGAGDLAVLWVKSHYDIRATRILIARQTHLQEMNSTAGAHPPGANAGGTAQGR
jgi:hypothetical protein